MACPGFFVLPGRVVLSRDPDADAFSGVSRWCSAAYLRIPMAKLPGTARHLDSGFRRNDGRGRHPGESRDRQRPISTR